MVHQGHSRAHSKHHQSQWNRVLFLLPSGNALKNCAANDAYLTGLAEFCLDVVDLVKNWAIAHKDNETVKRNATKMMRLHPQGLAPYVVGTPLLG